MRLPSAHCRRIGRGILSNSTSPSLFLLCALFLASAIASAFLPRGDEDLISLLDLKPYLSRKLERLYLRNLGIYEILMSGLGGWEFGVCLP